MLRLLSGLWLIFLSFVLIITLLVAALIVISPSQDVYGIEQNVVYSLQRVIAGEPLYTNPEQPPYNIVQYTPVYYAITTMLARLAQIEASDTEGVYRIARIVSGCFGIATVFVLLQICREFGLRRKDMFTLLVFGIIVPIPWYFVARPDSIMAFFEALSLYFFIRYLRDEPVKSRALIFSGIALAFAVYAKQSAIIVLGSSLIFPFYREQIRDRLRLLGGFALGLLGAGLIFWNYASLWSGTDNAFFMNIFGGINNAIDIERALWVYSIYLRVFFPAVLLPLMITSLTIFQLWRAWVKGGRRFKVFQTAFLNLDKTLLFLILSTWALSAVALIMALKGRSAVNYMNESMMVAMILVGYFFASFELQLPWQKNSIVRFGVALLLVFSIFRMVYYWGLIYGEDAFAQNQRLEWSDSMAILDESFAEQPDSYFIYFPTDEEDRWLNLYYPMQSLLQPREVYNIAFFDLSSLQSHLDNGSLAWLITDKRELPENIFGYTNFQDYFELWQETDSHLIYHNRNSEE
jgi:hypothetical protein